MSIQPAQGLNPAPADAGPQRHWTEPHL